MDKINYDVNTFWVNFRESVIEKRSPEKKVKGQISKVDIYGPPLFIT